MNARMREHYEVAVVSNETIEANLAFLRAGVDEVKADCRSLRDKTDQNHQILSHGQTALRDKIDTTRAELSARIEQLSTEMRNGINQVGTDQKTLHERLDRKIEQGHKDLDEKIEQGHKDLDEKIEQGRKDLDKKIEQGDKDLATKIDHLSSQLSETNVCVARVATMQKAMFWVIGGLMSLAALVEMLIRAGTKFHWF